MFKLQSICQSRILVIVKMHLKFNVSTKQLFYINVDCYIIQYFCNATGNIIKNN